MIVSDLQGQFLLTTVLNLWALVSEVYNSKKFVSVVKNK